MFVHSLAKVSTISTYLHTKILGFKKCPGAMKPFCSRLVSILVSWAILYHCHL